MSNDSYTPSASQSPPPPGGRTAQEWDGARHLAFQFAIDSETVNSVAETRLRRYARKIVAKPSIMGPASYTGPELDETLRVISRPKDNVMYTNKMTLNAYDHAIKRQIRVGELSELIIHILNFDFSLATRQIFSTLEPQARALYHSRNTTPGADRIKVWLTVTPEFAREWWLAPLLNWLNWRAEERVAGRDFYVQYDVSRQSQELSQDELENFRQFLHYNDPYGTMPGDMGGIMKAMKFWFMREYTRRGF